MGSTTKTVNQQAPPQLMPEGAPGYAAANQFYMGQLQQPSVYGGQRFEPENTLQRGAYQRAADTLYNPWPTQGATDEFTRTIGGRWLTGPEAQASAQGLAQPIFERFENQTMPGIRDASQFSSGGMGGSRRDVANTNAIQELGYNIGQGAIAPVYNAERDRMTRQAIEGSTGIINQDIAGVGAMSSLGETQRKLDELGVGANRDIFEEALARQGASSEALTAAATTGPGGTTSLYNPSTMRMILGSGKA